MSNSAKTSPIESSGSFAQLGVGNSVGQGIDHVIVELDHLKRRTERLNLMNALHGRMAGILSVGEMIEAYSVWLMPQVGHELIGYSNGSKDKKHLFCSGHGPNRRRAIAFAEKLISDTKLTEGVSVSGDGHYAHKWIFENADNAGILLILKENKELDSEEIELINESLLILGECLQRGLEYEELFQRASQDALTGLSNRRVFHDRIYDMMEGARRYNRPLTMISMDLDHFKNINDTLGHGFGDEVLKQVAEVLKEAIRASDLLVRMGGDEFVLVLSDTDQISARILAERLCKAVDELDVWSDEKTKLGISIGLAQLEKGETLSQWLERADDILYHAKAEGRSRVAVK